MEEKKIAWMMILSFLDVQDLLTMRRVNKTIHGILQKGEKFWQIYSSRRGLANKKPTSNQSWREFFFKNYHLSWEESKLKQNFVKDEQNDRILIDILEYPNWRTIITKDHLMEGMMYPFILSKM